MGCKDIIQSPDYMVSFLSKKINMCNINVKKHKQKVHILCFI